MMIMKKLQRIAAGVIIMASVLAINPIAAHAEWKNNSTGWWYVNGNSWYTGWKQIDGKWYFFGDDGYMVHNEYINNYYLTSQGYWDGAQSSLSVKYPSSWTKSLTKSGEDFYTLDNKGTSVYEKTLKMGGASRDSYLKAFVQILKTKYGIDKVDTSEQTINGKTVDVLDCKYTDSAKNMVIEIHQVVFYGNTEAYAFLIGGLNDISSDGMSSFNNMLKTVAYK